MSKDDLYKTLGISPEADDGEIRSAYKNLAKKYHPDVGEGSSEERFRAVQDAYDVLGDPDKRREYDRVQIPALGIRVRRDPVYGARDPGHIDLRGFRFGGTTRREAPEEREAPEDIFWRLFEILRTFEP